MLYICLLSLFALLSCSSNASTYLDSKEQLKCDALDSLHVYALVGDSVIAMSDNISGNLSHTKLVIMDKWDNNGAYPWSSSRNEKCKHHYVRTISINAKGDLYEDCRDSTYYSADKPDAYIPSYSTCHIYGDSIWCTYGRKINGGIYHARVYVKGYYVSTSSRGGGAIFVKRTPDEQSNKPIAPQHFKYAYYDDGKVKSIERINEDAEAINSFYSIEYSNSGIWNLIKYGDITIKRNVR